MSDLLVRIALPDGRVFFVPFDCIGIDQWMRYCAEQQRASASGERLP